MKTKIMISVTVLLLIALTTVKLLSNKHNVETQIYQPDVQKKILVQADSVVARSIQKQLTYTGTFAANREVLLVPQVHGEVESIFFDEGDIVSQGKALVHIDDDLLQTKRSAAEANFENAKRNLERYENAAASGGVSGMQVDNLRLIVKTAESELKQLQKQIALSTIRAPFTGTITLRDVEIGSVVGSMPVARVTDMSQLKLEISVPEREIPMLKEGEHISIETDIDHSHVLSGRIEYVSDRADHAHNYLVRIVIRNNAPASQLKAGMYGTAILESRNAEESLIIPRAALLGSSKQPQVFIIQEGQASLRSITIGQSTDDFIEVIEGLHAGDMVVISGHINLAEGSMVEIIKS